MTESTLQLLKRAAAMLRDGRRITACLLVKARGSTPQSAGALMLVDEDANTFGTVGGGCVEAEVRRQAHALLAESRSGLLRFKLDHDYGWDDGLICGGTIELAVGAFPALDRLETIIGCMQQRLPAQLPLDIQTPEGRITYTLDLPPRERLYIAGAGHVGQALARLALRLEFDVSIFDDREDLLDRYAPEDCAQVSGEIAERLRGSEIDGRTYAVVVTRGHRHDEQALQAVIGRGAAYVGMIGSRRKVKVIFDDLMSRGVPRSELEGVHAPIGLDIGSITVEEIAVSIVAQLVQVRRRCMASAKHGPISRIGDAGVAAVVTHAVTRGG